MADYVFMNESKSSSYTSSSSGDESEYDTYESDSSSNKDGRGEIQPYIIICSSPGEQFKWMQMEMKQWREIKAINVSKTPKK